MRKTVIFNTQIPELNTEKADDLDFCKQYPGAEWIPLLRQKLKQAQFNLLSAKEALEHKDILSESQVINEEWSHLSETFYRYGASIKVGYCFESKMYAPNFYDGINYVKEKTHFQYYFGEGNQPFFFPAFSQSLKRVPLPWKERMFSCMVAANKQYWALDPKPHSPSFKSAIRNELHTTRLKIIDFMADTYNFTLFGQGWTQGVNNFLYSHIDEKLRKLNPQVIPDKHAVQSLFKFAFCIENTAEQNYLTEKLIHAISSHTVPIYLGDPFVHKYIPRSIFIDLRDFKNLNEMYMYLISMPEKKWADYIEAGIAWLKTEHAKRHSFEYWADDVFKILNDKSEAV